MDSTERQVIDELFDKIRRAESRSGPRDPQAEARIREHLAEQPAAPYYMAQAILIQEQALAAANARIEQLERQLSEQPAGGFLGGLFGTGGTRPVPAQPSRADGWDPRIAAYANPRYGRGGGGFLAGAMQTGPAKRPPLFLANHSNLDGAAARVNVVVDQDHLLPGAEAQPAVADRDRHGGAEKSSLHMAVTVAVVPGHLVGVGRIGRREPLNGAFQVVDGARLVFDRRQ
jgi:hypothetical protein